MTGEGGEASLGPAPWTAGHALGSMDLGVSDGPQEGVCGEWGRDPPPGLVTDQM